MFNGTNLTLISKQVNFLSFVKGVRHVISDVIIHHCIDIVAAAILQLVFN